MILKVDSEKNKFNNICEECKKKEKNVFQKG